MRCFRCVIQPRLEALEQGWHRPTACCTEGKYVSVAWSRAVFCFIVKKTAMGGQNSHERPNAEKEEPIKGQPVPEDEKKEKESKSDEEQKSNQKISTVL